MNNKSTKYNKPGTLFDIGDGELCVIINTIYQTNAYKSVIIIVSKEHGTYVQESFQLYDSDTIHVLPK